MDHLHHGSLNVLKEIVMGFPEMKVKQHGMCKGCRLAKYVNTSFPRNNPKSKGILDLAHSDVSRPMSTTSLSGYQYYVWPSLTTSPRRPVSISWKIRTRPSTDSRSSRLYSRIRQGERSIHWGQTKEASTHLMPSRTSMRWKASRSWQFHTTLNRMGLHSKRIGLLLECPSPCSITKTYHGFYG